MIFVTVGTHEQQFNRLIMFMDEWAELNKETVIIQTGFSSYEPNYCIWKNIYSYSDMITNIKNARIVITHGGPSSIIMSLQNGKIPIVVPRRKEYGEHVNNHQVDFCNFIYDRNDNIILIENINLLNDAIDSYDELVIKKKANIDSNNDLFCAKFEECVKKIIQ